MYTKAGTIESAQMSVNDYDEELHTIACELEDRLELEKGTPEYGITQQVICQGYGSLTEKQRYIYDTKVAPLIKILLEEWEMNRIMNSNPD
jgi:hypothetical protein